MRGTPRNLKCSLTRAHAGRRHGLARKPGAPASGSARDRLEELRALASLSPALKAKVDGMIAMLAVAETGAKEQPPHEDPALELSAELRAELANLHARAQAGSERAARRYWNKLGWHTGERPAVRSRR